MSLKTRQWRLYESRDRARYTSVEAAQCRTENRAYVFLDAWGNEIVRYPMDEYVGLVCVSAAGETGEQ